jgi:hypothetical protein
LTKRLQPGDVVDDLTSAARDRPLSANQGKALNDRIERISGYFERGVAKAAKAADVAAMARKLETPSTVGVSLSGFTSGSGGASFDGSGNVNIAIATQGTSSDGCAAESSIPIPRYGPRSGWVSLGTFTMTFSGTFKISYISGMTGADWTIIHGTRSGEHNGFTASTIINNQQRNYPYADCASGIRVYSQNRDPLSAYKVFLYVPSHSGGILKISISAECGVTLPIWDPSGFKPLDLIDTSDKMFPSASDYPVYWSPGGNNTSIVTYPIGYTTSTVNWWVRNPKT